MTIVHFFQPDEYPEFAEWVMPRIMFEKKLQILGKILDFVGLRETYQADLTEMNRLREERNVFAHDPMHFDGRSFLNDLGNYQVRTRKLLGGTKRSAESSRDRPALRALIDRAQAVTKKYMLEIGPAITEAHAAPQSYFFRSGWDPQHFFTAPPAPRTE